MKKAVKLAEDVTEKNVLFCPFLIIHSHKDIIWFWISVENHYLDEREVNKRKTFKGTKDDDWCSVWIFEEHSWQKIKDPEESCTNREDIVIIELTVALISILKLWHDRE